MEDLFNQLASMHQIFYPKFQDGNIIEDHIPKDGALIELLQSHQLAKPTLVTKDYYRFYYELMDEMFVEQDISRLGGVQHIVYDYMGSYGWVDGSQPKTDDTILVPFTFLIYLKARSSQEMTNYNGNVPPAFIASVYDFVVGRPSRLNVFLQCCLPTRTLNGKKDMVISECLLSEAINVAMESSKVVASHCDKIWKCACSNIRENPRCQQRLSPECFQFEDYAAGVKRTRRNDDALRLVAPPWNQLTWRR